jgi:hypothetical protein
MGGSSVRPEFIDNRKDNTLSSALSGYINWLIENKKDPLDLSIATGYFSAGAFSLIADELEQVGRLRLLLGTEPERKDRIRLPKPGEPTGQQYDEKHLKSALATSESDIRRDRDLLGFSEELDKSLKRLVHFLHSEKVEVRRYNKRFLHGKAFIFSQKDGVVSGSSNFTYSGLSTNLELNLGHYQPSVDQKVVDWFEDLWGESEPYDLAEIYEARFLHYDPHLIYLRVLWERYGKEIRDETPPETPIQLTTFQNDGVFRAERILDTHHGVVVADGVGLGKTYIGGELLHRAIRERRQRALVISPASLRDGMWSAFQDRYQMYFENISFEQLANEMQVGGQERYLKNSVDEYALVVIDEAHAFRNPQTKRANALRLLLQGDPPRDLILMTATPVNNSLWDLFYLLSYFVGHDAAFASEGIPSLKNRFDEAQSKDPYELTPNLLFDVLDSTTVRRTRHFVKEHYPGETIIGPEGKEIRIRFPQPNPIRIDYEMGDDFEQFFYDFKEALAPDEGDPSLTLARYWPSRYLLQPEEPDASQLTLTGLLRIMLLKRFESSARSFKKTVSRMIGHNEAVLRALDLGYVPLPAAIEEWTETDSDEVYEEILEELGSDDASEYDVTRLRADVTKDIALLRKWEEKTSEVTLENDSKLESLREALLSIVERAEKEGTDENDRRQKRKVIIFSFYEDTVDWIEEYLQEVVREGKLACYRERVASVSGEDSRHGISRKDAVWGFAPVSTEAPPGTEDKYDILITTDVLAEGGNLQQCRNIINFDLPWNPMRIVQRNGRIDRLASPHNHVYVHCFFPSRTLDEMLELEYRVRKKLAQAAATIGIESEVIPGVEPTEQIYGETREEIRQLMDEQAEYLERGGEDAAVYSGEEYRQDLRKGLIDREEEILSLPWGAGSGMQQGDLTGHFFCARVGDTVYLRFVPEEKNTEIIKDTLTCLKLIACEQQTKRVLPDERRNLVYPAWECAKEDIFQDWSFQTDPKNIEPKIRPLFRRVSEHLRKNPPKVVQGELEEIIESVEAPWGRRYERQLREILQREDVAPIEISNQLVSKIKELGMRPFKAPEPLPRIEEDQIKLVCWMAIQKEE